MQQGNIRNFVIIAHVDHGKSTLADRFLELTGAVEKRKMREQFLDNMELEREKGITIKLQPIRLKYKLQNSKFEISDSKQEFVLNLIDTPGHADFSYEVSRSLAAVEGAILLVDGTKGVQAQTLANLKLAQREGLAIIPAINKIDLPSPAIEEVSQSIAELLNIDEKEIFRVSAKTGQNVEQLLWAVITTVPAAKEEINKPLQALVFDSHFDNFKGVVAYVRVTEGVLKPLDAIVLMASGAEAVAKEVGYFNPLEIPESELRAGQIGYVATGLKEPGLVRIGDTITLIHTAHVTRLEGYASPKPVVFLSFYPQDPYDFDTLKDGLAKLRLNDPSFVFEQESHEALGRGFRCGFLGVLHSEIIAERLQREYTVPLILSRPSVEFRLTDIKGKEISIKTASDWPESHLIASAKEPWAKVEVITPMQFFSQSLQLLQTLEGGQIEMNQLGDSIFVLIYEAPLREIIIDFYDRLKSVSHGMASMDYEIIDFRPADLVKLEILVAGRREEAFSQVVPRQKTSQEGRKIVEKLKELLPPQLFSVALQAVVGGKVIARETIKARRRDVTAPLYGGDVTRKRKLLEKQKKGKEELREKGRVSIPPKVFLDIFRS